jgi:hypothetical protein
MAPATFLTSLGLLEAAMTRTNAILSSIAGAGASTNLRIEGSPKVSKRIARMEAPGQTAFVHEPKKLTRSKRDNESHRS